jgi:hypothetical protein
MKTYLFWGVEIRLYPFLTSALDGGERSASRLGRFISGVRSHSMHWIEKNPTIAPAGSRTPVVQPVA